jgi:tetratricopeptide (TPR) repeat protein
MLVLAVVPLAAQRPAPPQRGGVPRADTPQLVVSVFTSADPALGVSASDAVRRRIQSEHTTTDLYVVPRTTIEQTLRSSGYNPDSALAPSDIMALTKQVRGDYALAGTIERTSAGVRTSVRLLTQRGQEIVAEPLSPIVGADFGDIAKQVDRAVSEAIRALSFYQDCWNAARLGDYPKAMAAAQQGLRLRPTSASLNLCVLSTLNAMQASPDSIAAVASRITSVDSTNVIAWGSLAYARAQMGDTAGALVAAQTLHHLDPANPDGKRSLVFRLVTAGQPEPALALLDTALRDAPTNAELLKLRWQLHFRLGRAMEALASGAALVAVDSSAATEDFYGRQLTMARDARDSVSAHRLAVDASARFPKNVSFLLTLARDAVNQGSSREALALVERALSIEPANGVAWQLAISAHARAGAADSAVATARRALAAGVPVDAVGTYLVAVVSPAFSAAQASGTRADWDAALRVAQVVDSVAPSPRSGFYLGVSAFQVATDEIQSLAEFSKKRAPTRAERATACSAVARVDDLVRVVTIALPRGGSVSPDAAGKIMTALPGYSEFTTSVKRASCR